MSAQTTKLTGQIVTFIRWIFESTDNIDNTLLHNFIYNDDESLTKIKIQAGGEDDFNNVSMLPAVYTIVSKADNMSLNPMYDYTIEVDSTDRTSGAVVDTSTAVFTILCGGITPAQSEAIASEIKDKLRALKHVLPTDFDAFAIDTKQLAPPKAFDPKNPAKGYFSTVTGVVTFIDAWEVT